MIDPESRALLVEDVQNLKPKELQALLGQVASHGLVHQVLTRSDIRIYVDDSDEFIKFLENIPKANENDYFRYKEFLGFAQGYLRDKEPTQTGIQKKVTLLWNRFANGGGVYSHHRYSSTVAIRQDTESAVPFWGNEIRRNAVDPCCRDMFSLSLGEAVEMTRGYASYVKDPRAWNPLYGVGRETIETFAHFAINRIAATDSH